MLLRTALPRAAQACRLPGSRYLRSPGGAGPLRRSAIPGVDASLGGRPEGLVDRTTGVQPPRGLARPVGLLGMAPWGGFSKEASCVERTLSDTGKSSLSVAECGGGGSFHSLCSPSRR